jgi:hypothetical protein
VLEHAAPAARYADIVELNHSDRRDLLDTELTENTE